jgi:hypothetical protein
LPLKLIKLVNSKATRLLLKPLTLNAKRYLIALKNYSFAQKLPLTARSLLQLSSRRSSGIYLTLNCEDLRPGCVR